MHDLVYLICFHFSSVFLMDIGIYRNWIFRYRLMSTLMKYEDLIITHGNVY
jgi:hypothetical protein